MLIFFYGCRVGQGTALRLDLSLKDSGPRQPLGASGLYGPHLPIHIHLHPSEWPLTIALRMCRLIDNPLYHFVGLFVGSRPTISTIAGISF